MAVENKRFIIFITAAVSFLRGYFAFTYVYMCASVYVYAICVQMPLEVEGIGSPRAGGSGIQELSSMGAGNSSALSC